MIINQEKMELVFKELKSDLGNSFVAFDLKAEESREKFTLREAFRVFFGLEEQTDEIDE